MNKGLNHLKSLINQPVGNRQCYAVSAEYAGIMFGPGMGSGTKYDVMHQIGNIYSAAEIGSAYDWGLYKWSVITDPTYDQLVVGAIINWNRGGKVADWNASEGWGHTGVIRGLEDGRIQTYEQNAEVGEIVAEYDREYFGQGHISSIVIPPDFIREEEPHEEMADNA